MYDRMTVSDLIEELETVSPDLVVKIETVQSFMGKKFTLEHEPTSIEVTGEPNQELHIKTGGLE